DVSGRAEDIIVGTKVILLGLFVVAAAQFVQPSNLLPVFDRGPASPVVAGALVFVAFEGFQLITNAVMETRRANHDIPLGIYGSIVLTSIIYIAVAVVALGNLGAAGLIAAEEYALAAAAQPALGHAGTVLVDVAALLATSSAINATLFGASRMLAEMATESRVPRAFSHRSRTQVPWLAVLMITVLALGFTAMGSLEVIATFSSLVFLLVSLAVAVSNWRLRARTHANPAIIAASVLLMGCAVGLLVDHLRARQPAVLGVIVGLFLVVSAAEVLFYKRSVVR
ncbi:MAG: amino acid permease, partial [Oligoflexia bacterium]|nr:amino acid permease [Oligoflexia bacterium]